MMLNSTNYFFRFFSVLTITALFINACSNARSEEQQKNRLLALPIYVADTSTASTIKDYFGTIEGKLNVEIRPQVEGILREIYVDEGDYVTIGQKLFKVDPSAYQEVWNNAKANENVAKARLENAKLEVERLKPLVENDVISEVRLKSAMSDYEVAKASLEQASAAVRGADININFTIIEAPINGYIGRIPKRIGNLVTKNDNQALTVLSDVKEVYVYFSMSESDFLYFSKMKAKEDSIAGIRYNNTNKLTFPDVQLILADGEIYSKLGKVDAVSGQVNRATGAISLRASFLNDDNILRTGSTGTLKISEIKRGVLQVPQIATSELQDKTIVYVLDEENKVRRRNIKICGKSKANYIVCEGLAVGDRVILSGFDKVTEGSEIIPIEHVN